MQALGKLGEVPVRLLKATLEELQFSRNHEDHEACWDNKVFVGICMAVETIESSPTSMSSM